MVDLHSHILPGLDDGPATIEESVAMIRMAAADGVTDIVATPHANSAYTFDAASPITRLGWGPPARQARRSPVPASAVTKAAVAVRFRVSRVMAVRRSRVEVDMDRI